MPNPLGDFDVVLQVPAASLGKIFQAMHVAGSFRRLYTGFYNDRFVTLVMSPPAITPLAQTFPDGKVRATTTGRLLYHSRLATDATDLGYTAVVDVTARARINFTTAGDPAPLANSALALNWSETTDSDITVYGPSVAQQAEVKAVVRNFITADTDTAIPLPPLNFGSAAIGNGSLAFIGSAGSTAVAAGFNIGTATKGNRTQLQSVFVASDWAVGINATFLSAQLRAEIGTSLGAVPPPHGTGRPELSDTSFCFITNPLPFGPTCLGNVRQQVFLDSLDWTFTEGKILFSGQFTQTTDSIFIPPVSASFQFEGVPCLTANGQVTMAFSQPSIQIHEWYANFVNFLSGGAITQAVTKVMTSALSSVLNPGGAGLISVDALSQFTALGSIVQLPLSLGIQSIRVHSYGLVIQGSLQAGPTTGAPVAAFRALPASTGPTGIIFNAQSSWCPGGLPVSYHWDFGDGTTETTTATNERFVTAHTYAPGNYQACLTVTDSQGGVVRTCSAISPGLLQAVRLSITNPQEGNWVICRSNNPFTVRYRILSSGLPATDASMTLASGNWHETRTAGADGVVLFTGIDPVHFVPMSGGWAFCLGGMSVTITKPGYAQSQQTLWLYDCAAAAALRDVMLNVAKQANQLAREIIDPLGPVMHRYGEEAPDPSDPIMQLTRDTVLVSEIILKTTQLLSISGDTSLLGNLFGVKATDAPNVSAKKIQTAYAEIAHNLKGRASTLLSTATAKLELTPQAAEPSKSSVSKKQHALARLVHGSDKTRILNIRRDERKTKGVR